MENAVSARQAKPASKVGRNDRRQALRKALIDAGEKVVATKGLPGLKARDLAVKVGCALGAIYTVFPDLDAIIYEINSRTLEDFELSLAKHGKRSRGHNRGGERSTITELVGLAVAYLDFAVANQPRWRALFDHQIATPGADLPDWYVANQRRLFILVEKPLGILQPELDAEQRALFARTLFSAVHGIISLGLDKKIASLPVGVIREQVKTFVTAIGRGLVLTGSGSNSRQ